MDDDAAHRSLWRTSDAVVAVTLALGLGLHTLLPIALSSPATTLRVTTGAALIVVGLAVVVLAKRALRRRDQSAAPGSATTRIVDTGVYRISRNPLYLGLVVLLTGLGLAFAILWWTLLAVPMALALHHWLILPEERYLRHHFGREYETYCTRVRRWL